MKKLLLIIIFICPAFNAFGQNFPGIPNDIPRYDGAKKSTEKENKKPDDPINKPELPPLPTDQVAKILEQSGKHFKQGLFYLTDSRRDKAREEFDSSVEEFLTSTVDVNRDLKLRECYEQLIETIYRMEFSNNQVPQIRKLIETCGWNIDSKLVDDIAKNSQIKPNSSIDGTTASSVVGGQTGDTQNGFSEQSFEASPLEELAKLQLDEPKPTAGKSKTAINIEIVTARTGDTVEILAKRHFANPIEVAKFNGIFVNSKLNTGRIVKIPRNTPAKSDTSKSQKPNQPTQLKDGTVPAVMTWFNENINDPYSLKIVRWGKLGETYANGNKVLVVCVKFRAKNPYNAYILSSMRFSFANGKITSADKIADCQ